MAKGTSADGEVEKPHFLGKATNIPGSILTRYTLFTFPGRSKIHVFSVQFFSFGRLIRHAHDQHLVRVLTRSIKPVPGNNPGLFALFRRCVIVQPALHFAIFGSIGFVLRLSYGKGAVGGGG